MSRGTVSLRAGRRSRPGPLASALAALALAALAVLALGAGAARAAGPPIVESSSFSEVGATSATLEAEINPNGAKTSVYHFQYVDLAGFEASGFAAAKSTPDGPPLAASSEATALAATIEGLLPNTAYRFRAIAENTKGKTEGPVLAFNTLTAPQAFGPCPNDAFRLGQYAAPGQPSALLPDCRAYEQASPVEKNGNDVLGVQALAKAAVDGGAVSFGSIFGLPGGEGAQVLPSYLASRGEGEAGWSTGGLLAPAAAGQVSRLLGWLPDFSAAYASADRFTSPRTQALFELRPGAAPARITPYLVATSELRPLYSYAGASADGGVVVLEAERRLPEEEGGEPIALAREDAPNVYARERASGRTHLASRLNTAKETEAALPQGAFAGPYNWARGLTRRGGVADNYYVQDTRAISSDGSAYFTAAGSGQLYLRLHPTQPQSALDGEGNCTEAARACTLHVSASEKENGKSPEGSDPAGPQPAAFQAASADGQVAFFTSSEKLTNDANTGPEQALAEIGRLKAADGEPPAEEKPDLIATHALGLAVSPDGQHLYWADPSSGEIMRANLDGTNVVSFASPGPTECEVTIENGAGEDEKVPASAPSTPRYVAVDSEYLYWTNTGPLGEREPEPGCGTIGRARIDPLSGEAEEEEPEWIGGASNPEGVAVNAGHVYWANAATSVKSNFRGIGRARLDGAEVEPKFFETTNESPRGVALDATHVYFSMDNEGSSRSYVSRVPLAGGEEERLLLRENGGTAGIRGIALSGGDVYWATKGEEAIGRAPLGDLKPGECPTMPGCELEYLPLAGQPFGLAADAAGHLYYSLNGEAPTNPGNDLYRYSATPDSEGRHLTDVAAEPGGDGAEVQGVLGAAADGSRLYFVANGALAPGAEAGDCHEQVRGQLGSTRGECNLYLWRENPEGGAPTTTFIARLEADGVGSDTIDWVPTPEGELFGASRLPKTAAASEDGRTLLFASERQLTTYRSEGTSELYRYREGEPLACISCNPSGAAPSQAPLLGTRMSYPTLGPRPVAAALATRFLAADGERAFFETGEALVGEDTDANSDVYEWEAPGAGSCSEGAASYVAQNGGCLYLLSPGEDGSDSLFVDASASGEDAFILTRARLAGQDRDQLFDAYDARVGGGLAAQNPPPLPSCEADECKGPYPVPPAPPGAASSNFQGPGNPPAPKPRCPKGKRAVHRHGRWVCVPRHRNHHHPRRPHR